MINFFLQLFSVIDVRISADRNIKVLRHFHDENQS